MRGIRRHTYWYNIIFLAYLVECGGEMTIVAIKDQKTMFPFRLTFDMRNEVFLEPINANFITRPAVWTNVKRPMF